MLLYIHIPFCVKKCAYCDFLSAPADAGTIRAYTEALKTEIRQKAACVPEKNVTSIFFGGGTPSLLPASQMTELMEAVTESFSVDADAEITAECNPGTANTEKLQAMKRAGVNRLSIGLQSVHDTELATLHRSHRAADFFVCFEAARKAGFRNINTDLIYGLPGQTAASFAATLHRVCALLPEHISVYHLIIEEGTPFFDRYHTDAERRDAGRTPRMLPAEEEEERMEQALSDILTAYGYTQYEISNYARNGKECRHNTGYWTGVEYLGLGLGAASMMDGLRYHNTGNLSEYLNGMSDAEEVVRLTKKMQREEFMFLGLRLLRGVRKSEFYRRFGRDMMQVYGAQISALKEQKLLEETAETVRLTGRGLQAGNLVFASFIE